MFISKSPQTDRQNNRQMFYDAWQKHKLERPLTGLEKQVASVVEEHPEYHALVEQPIDMIHKEFTPENGEVNPFLHMGLHLALREQVGTDRPVGIKQITRSLLIKHSGEGHAVEHMMMDCLAESLWQSQRDSRPPDEIVYMEALNRLL